MSLNPKLSIGESVQILIPPGKEEEFWAIITEEGFEKSGKGILDFIMEPIPEGEEFSESEDGSEISAKGVLYREGRKWADENPDEWERIKKKGSHVIGSLLSKISKKL